MLGLKLLDKDNQPIIGKIDQEKAEGALQAAGEKLCSLGIKDYLYQIGDKICVTFDKVPSYAVVQLDETLAPTLIYTTKKEWIFEIPLEENLAKSSVDTASRSRRHSLMVREAYDFELKNYRNLSSNPHDQKQETGIYPHAFANVETRGESVFFAKNAIDLKYSNLSHGSYPFSSWGINQQADAALTLDFGRLVEVDRVKLLFRHDFPHDSYWKSLELEFSDHSSLKLLTSDSAEFQEFEFPKRKTRFIKLKNLQKAEGESVFPALTQLEVFGKNLIEEE